MKKNGIILLLLVIAFGSYKTSNGQILKKLDKKIERKVSQRIERKTDQAIDKALDKVEEGIDGKPGKEDPVPKQEGKQPENSEPANSVSSKFDFIPGEKILFLDNFVNDPIGDFPARWNTNNSGEVVSISNLEGKWLKVPDNTLSFPELKSILPENFTIEFDLFYPSGRPPVTFGFTEVGDPARSSIQHKKLFYFHIPPTIKDNVGYSTSLYSGRETTQSWPANKMAGKIVRVSIAVNKSRIRLYMDNNKVFDLPKAFDLDALRNNFHFRAAPLLPAPEEAFYIGNLRIAESGLDARNQLLNNGKYSTTGIYFESGSATIKQESAGILKEIAAIINDNPDLRIVINGHTDSDGAAAANQELSRKRAEAVKAFLIQTYPIDAQRIETDGKGATQPVGSNQTAEGKAQNRRVEFLKR